MIHFGLEGIVANALYLGAIGAFLASIFWRPSIGLYLLVFTLPMQTGREKLHAMPLGSQFLDILLLGIIIGIFVHGGKLELKTPISGLLLLLAGFYYLSLWQGAFYIDSPLPFFISDPRFSNWKNYVEMFLWCLVVASVIKEPKQVKLLLLVMALSTLIVNRSFYSTMSGRDLAHFSYDTRYSGALGYAGENGFAAFEVMVAAFFLGIAAYVKRLYVKLGILFLVATCAYCLLFSFSRGGYVGILAAMIVLGLLKDRKQLIFVAAMFITWQTLLPQAVQERIAMTSQDNGDGQQLDSSAQERMDIWEDALVLIKADPVFGVGFNTYEFLGRVGPYRDTHNYYMKIMVETGMVGLVLFVWLLAKMWGLGYSLFRLSEDRFWASIGLGFLALICSATMMNLFGDRWTYQQVDGYLWVTLGLVIRGLIEVRRKASEDADDRDTEDNTESYPEFAEVSNGALTA